MADRNRPSLVALFSTVVLARPGTLHAQDRPAAPNAPELERGSRPSAAPARARPRGPEASLGREAAGDAESGVTVIGRDLPRVASSVSVASRRDLRLQQPLSPNEALRRMPGVAVRDEDGLGLRPNISIRGLDGTRSRRVLLLEDGVPIALNPYGEPEAYYMPPIERVDRIEVIRGSGAILYGPQTIGGVVNLVSPAVPRRPSLTASIVGGAPGYLSAHVMGGLTVANAGFLVSALRRQGVGFRSQGFTVTELMGKLRLELGAHEINVRLSVYDEGSATTYLGLTEPMFRQDPWQNPARYDYLAMRRYSASVTDTVRLAPGWKLQNTLFGYTTDRVWHRQLYDRIATYNPNLVYERIVGCGGDCATADPGGLIFLRNGNRNNDREYEVYGAQSRLEATVVTGPVRQEIDAGVRVLAERALRRAFFGSAGWSRTGTLDNEEQGDGLALSLFAQDRITVHGRWTLTPGVRFDYFPFTRNTRRVGGVDVFRQGSSLAAPLIAGVSTGYTLPWLTVFGGVHMGYAPPRVTVAIDPNTAQDRMLDAERSVNYELGARLQREQWLKLEATAFAMDFANEIIAGSFASGTANTEFINGGRSRYFGLEGSFFFDVGKALRRPFSAFVDLRATGVDARLLGGATDGRLVPYAVPFTASASLGYEHASGVSAMVTGLIVSRHYSDRENTETPTSNGLAGPIPTYGTVDVAARYTHRPTGLGVTLTVKNLQNQPWISSRLPEGIFPAGFTQVLVGLRWDRF
jgi:Fe(3+) dicitrate transport protein